MQIRFLILLFVFPISYTAFTQCYEAIYKGTSTLYAIGGMKIYMTYKIRADSNLVYYEASYNGKSLLSVNVLTDNEEALYDIKKNILYKFKESKAYYILPNKSFEIVNLNGYSNNKSIKNSTLVKIDKKIPSYIQPLPTLDKLPYGVFLFWKENLEFTLVSIKRTKFDFKKFIYRAAQIPKPVEVINMFDN